MDISNSSDDDESIVVHKKVSLKVSFFSREFQFILFLFQKPQKDEELSVAETEDIFEMSDKSAQQSVKKKGNKTTINNKRVKIIQRIV